MTVVEVLLEVEEVGVVLDREIDLNNPEKQVLEVVHGLVGQVMREAVAEDRAVAEVLDSQVSQVGQSMVMTAKSTVWFMKHMVTLRTHASG